MSRPNSCRRGVAALLLLVAALVFCLPASSAMAFNPYVPPEPPPPEGCLGSNDPYCQGGSGGGSGGYSCQVCELMLEDNTDPSTSYYGCMFVDPLVQNGYQYCTPGGYEHYCRLKTFCQIA
jgi:hypothetical protein